MSAASLLLAALPNADVGTALWLLAVITILVVLGALWCAQAPGLLGMAVPPTLAFLWRLITDDSLRAVLAVHSSDVLDPMPMGLPLLTGLLAMASLAALIGSLGTTDLRQRRWLASLGAALPVVATILLETLWSPADALGGRIWALLVLALAAVLVAGAERMARQDGQALARSGMAGVGALALIALALFITFTKAALTLGLALLLVASAALHRRFPLAELRWFIGTGLLVLVWRLLIDPGLGWAVSAPLWQVWLAHLAPVAGALVVWSWLPGRLRAGAELAATGGAALLTWLLIERLVPANPSYQLTGLMSLPVIAYWGWVLWRSTTLPVGAPGRWLWLSTAAGLGIGLTVVILAMMTIGSPLSFGGEPSALALTLGYALPALLLAMVAWHLPQGWWRLWPWLLAAAMAAGWVLFELRLYWRGDGFLMAEIPQGELYSHTIAMMLAGALLFWQALGRRSALLRRLAMLCFALTVVKVFTIDATGLNGLLRVAAFLGLGLGLAAVAWLNRWAAAQEDAPPRP